MYVCIVRKNFFTMIIFLNIILSLKILKLLVNYVLDIFCQLLFFF